MIGEAEIFDALNVSPITSVIGTYNDGPAIFPDPVVPADCIENRTLNFYLSSAYDTRQNIKQLDYTISCMDSTKKGAYELALTVLDEINRKTYDGYYLACVILPVIVPNQTIDKYNVPIITTIKLNK